MLVEIFTKRSDSKHYKPWCEISSLVCVASMRSHTVLNSLLSVIMTCLIYNRGQIASKNSIVYISIEHNEPVLAQGTTKSNFSHVNQVGENHQLGQSSIHSTHSRRFAQMC